MTIDTSQLDTDLGNLIDDMPTTFVYSGSSYTGALSDRTDGKLWSEEGFAQDIQATLTCQRSSFTTEPSVGVTIAIGITCYRIAQATRSADEKGVVFALVSPDNK